MDTEDSKFVNDDQNHFDVIIPTMGSQELIAASVERILRMTPKAKFKLTVVCNPTEEGKLEASFSKAQVTALCEQYNDFGSNGVVKQSVELNWIDMDAPAGWVGAVNHGVFSLSAMSPCVIIMNDDVVVTNNWAKKLSNALNTDRIFFESKVDMDESYYYGEGDEIESYGRLGLVGPLSTFVAGSQSIPTGNIEGKAEEFYGHKSHKVLDDFSAEWEAGKTGRVLNSDFLSGFCVAYKRECLQDLIESGEGGTFFLDPAFGIGGYDDNDIAARAVRKGWKLGIASDCYVHHQGHQTLDKHFPEMDRGLMNASVYAKKWAQTNSDDQKVIACMRVKIGTMHDLAMFFDCVRRNSQVVDGFAVLLTNNPMEIKGAYDFNQQALNPISQKLIRACGNASNLSAISNAMQEYLAHAVRECEHDVPITVDVWDGDFNERDERNKSIEMAEAMGADWVFSIDHDEFLEDRVDRALFRRLICHPNPNVHAWDFGWLNHWDTPRVCRVDPPWTSGYTSGMHGCRLWRVNKHPEARARITGGRIDKENDVGLHCGNSPEVTTRSRRVAGIRFRHFGYIRHQDRVRKHQFYTTIDPSPDMLLTGGGYSHLVNEENMQLSPYVPGNGIAFSMLLHKESQLGGLYRFLDHVYGLCDQIVLVWTGPEGTEPPQSLKDVAETFGAEWTYKPFNDDLSEVRNAALDVLRAKEDPRIRWFFTMDDDEHWSQEFLSLLSVRRMAECSNTWGWMFKFRNWRKDKTFNYSETLRMFLLDRGGVMKYSGRVHETVEKGLSQVRSMGLHPQVRFAPFETDHIGLGLDDDQMQEKLEFYTRLLALTIEDDPLNTGSWCSLGLQYMNDGMIEEAGKCFQNSVVVAGDSYLGFRELANWHLRQGLALLSGAEERLSPAHPLKALLQEQLASLAQYTLPFPVSGNAAGGNPKPTDVDLEALQALFLAALESTQDFAEYENELSMPKDFGGTVEETTPEL